MCLLEKWKRTRTLPGGAFELERGADAGCRIVELRMRALVSAVVGSQASDSGHDGQGERGPRSFREARLPVFPQSDERAELGRPYDELRLQHVQKNSLRRFHPPDVHFDRLNLITMLQVVGFL